MDGDGEKILSPWRRLSSEELADHGIFKTFRRRFENSAKGRVGDFFFIGCHPWVQVVAETPDGSIVLVEQYRFGSEKFSLELPGGMVEDGETVVAAAVRELEEETGFRGESAELVAELYPNPAIQDNTVGVVHIKNCRKTENTHFDEFEDLATTLVSQEELAAAIRSHKITHCITLAAISEYWIFRGGGA
jgi:8-oxo-dGTP pyrophosphatase MutT (NUDIX family)